MNTTPLHRIDRWMSLVLLVLVSLLPFASHAAELDSIEMLAKDPVATAKWYATNFGGKRAGSAIKFGEVNIAWKQAPKGGTTTNPAIAHLGFAVDGIDAKLQTLRKNKVTVLKDVHTGPNSRWAIVADPDGRAVGLLQYAGGKPGLNHVMLNAPLRERREVLSWYQKIVGGEISNFGGSPLWTGIQTNNLWLLFSDDLPGSDVAPNFLTATMTWRVDDIGPAKELQAERADSDEDIGEGLVVVDPCGLPVRFIEDPKAADVVQGAEQLAASAEFQVTDEQYEQIRSKEGEFTLEVIRVLGQDDCTLGQLFVNGIAIAYVLELPWQGNKPTIRSIPPGKYKLAIHQDTKQRMRVHLRMFPDAPEFRCTSELRPTTPRDAC
jgi:hypothetical protein